MKNVTWEFDKDKNVILSQYDEMEMQSNVIVIPNDLAWMLAIEIENS